MPDTFIQSPGAAGARARNKLSLPIARRSGS